MTKALSLSGFWSSNFFKTKTFAAKIPQRNRWTFYFAIALIAANLVLLASYIYGVNAFASKGYEIKVLQKRAKALEEENQKINLKISEAGSIVSIQSGFLSSNFVPAGTPKFLEANANQFSQR